MNNDELLNIFRCKRCNYLYIDEEQDKPFSEVGDEWKCPKCRSSKKLFTKKEMLKSI